MTKVALVVLTLGVESSVVFYGDGFLYWKWRSSKIGFSMDLDSGDEV